MKKNVNKSKQNKNKMFQVCKISTHSSISFLSNSSNCLPEPEPPLIHQRFELKHYPPGCCSLSSSKTVLQKQSLPTDHWVTLPSDSH